MSAIRFLVCLVVSIVGSVPSHAIPVNGTASTSAAISQGKAPEKLPAGYIISFMFTSPGVLSALPDSVVLVVQSGATATDTNSKASLRFVYERTAPDAAILKTGINQCTDESLDIDELIFESATQGTFQNKKDTHASGIFHIYPAGKQADGIAQSSVHPPRRRPGAIPSAIPGEAGILSDASAAVSAPDQIASGSVLTLTSDDGWTVWSFAVGTGNSAKIRKLTKPGNDLTSQFSRNPTAFKYEKNPSRPHVALIVFTTKVADFKPTKQERDWGMDNDDINYQSVQFELMFESPTSGRFREKGVAGKFEVSTDEGGSRVSEHEKNAEKAPINEENPGPLDAVRVTLRGDDFWLPEQDNIFSDRKTLALWTYIAANGSIVVRGAGTDGLGRFSPGAKIAYFAPDEINALIEVVEKVLQWSNQCRVERASGVEKKIRELRRCEVGFFFDGKRGYMTIHETMSRPWSPEGARSDTADNIKFSEPEVKAVVEMLRRYNRVVDRAQRNAAAADRLN